MRTVFAVVATAAGTALAAGIPVANGLVLLLGVLIGAVLTAAVIYRDVEERETDPVPPSDGPASRMMREEQYR